jgi:hypothetical protein
MGAMATWKFKARFDGKVFIPLEGVDLPVGPVLEAEAHPIDEHSGLRLSATGESPTLSNEAAPAIGRPVDHGDGPPNDDALADKK